MADGWPGNGRDYYYYYYYFVVVVVDGCVTKHNAFDSTYDHFDNMWINLLKWNICVELQEIFTGEARWKMTYIWEFAVLLAAHIAYRFLFTDDKKMRQKLNINFLAFDFGTWATNVAKIKLLSPLCPLGYPRIVTARPPKALAFSLLLNVLLTYSTLGHSRTALTDRTWRRTLVSARISSVNCYILIGSEIFFEH